MCITRNVTTKTKTFLNANTKTKTFIYFQNKDQTKTKTIFSRLCHNQNKKFTFFVLDASFGLQDYIAVLNSQIFSE